MSNGWFVVRDGREVGPLSAGELRRMAADRRLGPADLIRRDDMNAARAARTVGGLFPEPAVSIVTPAVARPVAAPAGRPAPGVASFALAAGSLALCFPAGLAVVWLSRRWSPPAKAAWTGAALGVWVGFASWAVTLGHRVQAQLAAADGLWAAGDRAAALEQYQALLGPSSGFLGDRREDVYGRVIDAEAEAGDPAGVERWLDRAARYNVVPAVSSPLGMERLAARHGRPVPAAVTPEDGEVVPALVLHSAYQDDEPAARRKYGGKLVIVDGVTGRISGASSAGRRVRLANRFGGDIITCALAEPAAGLPAGTAVRVRGRCAGRGPDGTVRLDDCVVLRADTGRPDDRPPAGGPTPPGPKPGPPAVAGGVVEPGNVALAGRGATADGPYRGVETLLDGKANDREYAKAALGQPIVVTFPRAYRLQLVRFKLPAEGTRFYRYRLEVSADGRAFEAVADRTAGEWRGWQEVRFAPRPVEAVRLTGTYNSETTGIHVVEFEAYCDPPSRPQ